MKKILISLLVSLGCLSGVEAAMQNLGIEVGSKGVRSAIEYLANT